MPIERLTDEAVAFAKAHWKEFCEQFAGVDYPSSEYPISIFMAGSPGAGKTEFSTNLIAALGSGSGGIKIVRIDPDEIRDKLPQYTGGNAHLFQYPVSIVVDRIHDYVLDQRKSFILDGTFSNIEHARKNITRSLKLGRFVWIEYLYLDPLAAWDFTQKREALEGRKIYKDSFILQFFSARTVVNAMKKEFGKRVQLNYVERSLTDNRYTLQMDIDDVDSFLKKQYTKEELETSI